MSSYFIGDLRINGFYINHYISGNFKLLFYEVDLHITRLDNFYGIEP